LATKRGILVQGVDGQFYDAGGTPSNGLYIRFYDKKATDESLYEGKNSMILSQACLKVFSIWEFIMTSF
jgi:hypothetical protein